MMKGPIGRLVRTGLRKNGWMDVNWVYLIGELMLFK